MRTYFALLLLVSVTGMAEGAAAQTKLAVSAEHPDPATTPTETAAEILPATIPEGLPGLLPADLRSPGLAASTLEVPQPTPALAQPSVVRLPVVQEHDKKGVPFMIAGGAALVAGLIIGGTTGNIVAAGGVALGVYGIIVYF
jgi:hypothetical protein